MSEKPSRDLFLHHDYQQYNYDPSSTFNLTANNIPESSSYHHENHNLVHGGGFDPVQLSFTDYLHGSMDYNTLERAFDLSCSSSEILSSLDVGSQNNIGGGGLVDSLSVGSGDNINPATPNSSVSSSSTEATADDDSGKTKKEDQLEPKVCEDGTELSKKVTKQPKKKVDKGQREPRFAFMTKSDVDHLEDGYRWRKYGQKAVKNSIYPRSYYRCTTQKCTVKKRVERSFQDPSIVITTYEGQHNHQSPAILRGNAARLLAPSMFASSSAPVGQMSFPHHQQVLLQHQVPSLHDNISQVGDNRSNSMYPQNLTTSSTLHQQLYPVLPDYGLLQDMVPSFIHRQQP